jgi:hypothetical protein
VIDKVSQEEFQQKLEELNEQPTQQEDENKSQKEEQPQQVGTGFEGISVYSNSGPGS